jgi:prepilin signal peptidase PulO-like enzyme (type II secretory pathway)
MELFIIIFFAILGALIGSFLNVVILRFNTGKGIDGRSGCFTCGKTLHWYELVPIVSYLVQQGKCRGCKSGVSRQYILVEFFTGLLFALISARVLLPIVETYSVVTILNLIIALTAVSVLMVIFVYDLRHKIIPDIFSYGFAFLALARLVLYYQTYIFSFPGILDLLAGPIAALPFALIWYFSKGAWMGFGDAKLALGIGWFLGLVGAVSALCLAFWIGAVVSVGLLVVQKYLPRSKRSLSFTSEVPFAPFLIIGLLIVYFFPLDLFHLKTFISFI